MMTRPGDVRSIAPYRENVPFYENATSRGNERKIKPGAAPFKMGADTKTAHKRKTLLCCTQKQNLAVLMTGRGLFVGSPASGWLVSAPPT
jgi:hypothetical protein